MQTATLKVPGGKLLRLKARIEEGKLLGPQLSGDFFLMPPEKISLIEEALEGFPVDKKAELKELLEYVIERENIRIQGMGIEDIVSVVGELQ